MSVTAAVGARPRQALRRAPRLRRCDASSSTRARCSRSSASPARARPRCCSLLSAQLAADAGARVLSHARRRHARSRGARRSGAALPVPHRLGLRAPGRDARPAHGRVGRRQCRRAADGGRLRATTAASATPRATGSTRVEIDPGRIDDTPRTYSGGMRQRLQIARNLVTSPRLVFMDEPTGGLDVSVQARLLDLLRGLVAELRLAAIVVTHDLAVARLLSHRIMVMKDGRVDRDRPDRPGARRSARALHAAARFLGAAAMSDAMPILTLDGVAKTFTMHLQGGVRLPVVDGVELRGARRRMRGARRAVGHRQIVDPEDDLRQLSLRRRPRSWCAPDDETVDVATRRAAPHPGAAPTRDRLCQPVPARDSARRRARRRRRAAGRRPAPRREAARARAGELLARLNLPQRLWGAAAGDLLRRRAAAHQHRARLPRRPADPAARRADRLARRRRTAPSWST